MKSPVKKETWITLAILSFLALRTMYGETMLIPAIHYIINGFEISYNSPSRILTANLVTGAIMTPIIGHLSDIHVKKDFGCSNRNTYAGKFVVRSIYFWYLFKELPIYDRRDV